MFASSPLVTTEVQEGSFHVVQHGPLPPPPPPSDVPPELSSLLLARERVLFGPARCEFASTEFAGGSSGDVLVTEHRLLLVAHRHPVTTEPEPALGELACGYTSLSARPGGAPDWRAVSKGVGRGLKEGLEGLISHPISGLKNEGVLGLVKGIGKGLFGVAAQPTLGAISAGQAFASRESALSGAGQLRAPGPLSISLPIGHVRALRADRRSLQLRVKCHEPWKVAIDFAQPAGAPEPQSGAQPLALAEAAGATPRAPPSAEANLEGVQLWTREMLRAVAQSPLGSFAAQGGGVDPRLSGAMALALAQEALAEWARMGVLDVPAPPGGQQALPPAAPSGPGWRVSRWNEELRLCASYPRLLAVPACVPDEAVARASLFRARGRAPVLCWTHAPPREAPSGTRTPALLRASQPLVGSREGGRCAADELLLRAAAAESPLGVLYVLDLRGPLQAAANQQVLGGGTESDRAAYPFCELEFCGVAGAAHVASAYARLRSLCTSAGGGCARELAHGPLPERVQATGWPELLSTLLRAAARATQLLSSGASVLVHCSDGWDRTAQVCSLAQLLIEPRCRTVRGFCALVEREWRSLGFRFRDRSGLGGRSGGAAEREPQDGDVGESPVWLQWLDAVWQCVAQFPTEFEFGQRLLLLLAHAARSGRYADFLCNSELERDALNRQVSSPLPSVWTEVLVLGPDGGVLGASPSFVNAAYVPASTAAPGHGAAARIEAVALYPSSAVRRLRLWEGYFLRHVSRE